MDKIIIKMYYFEFNNHIIDMSKTQNIVKIDNNLN